MTSKPRKEQRADGTLDKFPDSPPRDDLQNSLYIHDDSHQAALRLHYGNPETTLVLAEVPIGWFPGQVEGTKIPDLLIAFGIDRHKVLDQRGYAIDQQGKPPGFVLELAPVNIGRSKYTGNRKTYAEFGVSEYWRYDPSGGEFYDAPLAGDRLAGESYQEITIHEVDANRLWGHSEVLNLDLCWEFTRLRWWDPVAKRYLRTYHQAQRSLWQTLYGEEAPAQAETREAQLELL